MDLRRLDAEEQEGLFVSMTDVVRDSLGIESEFADSWIGQSWPERCRLFAAQCEAYLAYDGDLLIAFFVNRVGYLRGRKYGHLESAYVRKDYQGSGLAYSVYARWVFRHVARAPWRRYWLSGNVYNPIGLEGWRRRVPAPSNFYPAIAGLATPSSSLCEAARELAGILYPDVTFETGSGVLVGKTPPRPEHVGWSGNAAVDEYFASKVLMERGDTVLYVVDWSRMLLFLSIGEMLRAIPRAVGSGLRSRSTRRR